MLHSSAVDMEPRLFCEHLEQWRGASVDKYYDAAVSLFRSADFGGVGVVRAATLRVCLKGSKWCVLSQRELDDLMDHVGVRDHVTQSDFCQAFCKFVQWTMKPKAYETPGAVVQSQQRRYSDTASLTHAPAALSSRNTTYRRLTNDGNLSTSCFTSPLRDSPGASPMCSRSRRSLPSMTTCLPPIERSARSVDRLPALRMCSPTAADKHSSAASVCSMEAESHSSGDSSTCSITTASTRDLIRDKYSTCRSSSSSHRCLVGGASALNFRPNCTALRDKLVTSQAMKDYHNIFKGINVAKNGTVSMQEFHQHIARVAPDLLPNAQRMFRAACKRGGGKGKSGDGELDFRKLVSILFPSATQNDIKELVHMTANRKPVKRAGPSAQQLQDADAIFRLWNKSNDGLLTYDEAEDGLEALCLSEEDVDGWLEALFGQEGSPDARTCLSQAEFTTWFTSHQTVDLCV